jgi:hypothetical protein
MACGFKGCNVGLTLRGIRADRSNGLKVARINGIGEINRSIACLPSGLSEL